MKVASSEKLITWVTRATRAEAHNQPDDKDNQDDNDQRLYAYIKHANRPFCPSVLVVGGGVREAKDQRRTDLAIRLYARLTNDACLERKTGVSGARGK